MFKFVQAHVGNKLLGLLRLIFTCFVTSMVV